MNAITAILVNYKRPSNMEHILDALRVQTVQPAIMVINNGPMVPSTGGARLVDIPWNARPFVRHLFALYADTEWIMVMDDDLMPNCNTFLADALAVAAKRPDAIIGAYGCYLGKKAPYYSASIRDGEVSIIKGRFMLYRRALLEDVRFGRMPMQFGQRGDDIFISLEIGRGQPIHWADDGLRKQLTELPPGEVGLEHSPKHYAYREAFCEYYVKNLLD
jgi:hypothetical protein